MRKEGIVSVSTPAHSVAYAMASLVNGLDKEQVMPANMIVDTSKSMSMEASVPFEPSAPRNRAERRQAKRRLAKKPNVRM